MIILKQNELSKWLKIILLITTIACVIFCIVIVPEVGREIAKANPEFKYMYYPSLIFILITAVPVFICLWKVFCISDEISKDNSFSDINAKHLKTISKLSLLDCVLYLIATVLLVIFNLCHPGLLLIIFAVILFGIAIAVVSSLLSHLVQKASDMKKENDLTI